eukprot:GFYU01005253.1.p1 GENE.GFYU01005253.1~~GFYU01005253.1.p1  ORF type:complete len:415 (+),score=105.05 GFYU01005253.1:142-1245(+)
MQRMREMELAKREARKGMGQGGMIQSNNTNEEPRLARQPSLNKMQAPAYEAPRAPNLTGYLDEREKTQQQEAEKQRVQKEMTASEKALQEQNITPVFDPQAAPVEQPRLDITDLRAFLLNPSPRGGVVQCYIIRDKGGMNKFFPKYSLYLKSGDRFLLASRKRKKNKTSNYLISMEEADLSRSSGNFLGKLRSNFVGTEFTVFDKGANPAKLDPMSMSVSSMTCRQELAFVRYQSNILGSRGPRKMEAVIPNVKNGARCTFRPMNEAETIGGRFKSGTLGDAGLELHNKPPKWNEQLGAYVLNFNGRVTIASVKNFQLVSDDDPERVILQFGRVGKHNFTMDYQYPMSPLQAFAICLSSFDHKLACE